MKTRFEQIKGMNTKEMTNFMCRFTQSVLELAKIEDWCEYCPATKFCKFRHTGFEDWLNEDIKIDIE